MAGMAFTLALGAPDVENAKRRAVGQFDRIVNGFEHPTSNIERPTSNCFSLDVQCWMFDVHAITFKLTRYPKKGTRPDEMSWSIEAWRKWEN